MKVFIVLTAVAAIASKYIKYFNRFKTEKLKTLYMVSLYMAYINSEYMHIKILTHIIEHDKIRIFF